MLTAAGSDAQDHVKAVSVAYRAAAVEALPNWCDRERVEIKAWYLLSYRQGNPRAGPEELYKETLHFEDLMPARRHRRRPGAAGGRGESDAGVAASARGPEPSHRRQPSISWACCGRDVTKISENSNRYSAEIGRRLNGLVMAAGEIREDTPGTSSASRTRCWRTWLLRRPSG